MEGIENYLKLLEETIRENDKFLEENAKEVYNEVISLIEDSIENIRKYSYRYDISTDPMHFFLKFSILRSYSILLNFLSGNLPSCFYDLRLMLETLSICYIAGKEYPEDMFFFDKIKGIEEKLKSQKNQKCKGFSLSKLMKKFGEEVSGDPKALYHKISDNWIHIIQYIKRFAEHIMEGGKIPSFMILPIVTYDKDDLEYIKKLGQYLKDFRNIMKEALEKYYKK